MAGDGSGGRRVVLGCIGGPHGVKGWLRVQTFTEERATLLSHSRWMLRRGGGDWRDYSLREGSPHGGGLVVTLEGVSDRDAAQGLTGSEVAVWRDELPSLEDGEFYWSDLEGLAVVTSGEGSHLGVVLRIFETGANDVLVVAGERERLIPFVGDVVCRVDLEAGLMEVNWDPEF